MSGKIPDSKNAPFIKAARRQEHISQKLNASLNIPIPFDISDSYEFGDGISASDIRDMVDQDSISAMRSAESLENLEEQFDSLSDELSKLTEEQRKATNELKRQADVLEEQFKQAKKAAKEAKEDAVFSKHLSVASLIVSILAISAGSFGSAIIEIIKSVLRQLPS